jgi:transcriptional regulator with XRE-family HTH domain
MADMDDLKVGAVVRAVRRRRGLRQRDVAVLAGVSQWAISLVERGQLEQLPLRAICRVCSALEIGMPFAPRWRGGELPRLMDARHAALVEKVVASLAPLGWEVTVEYTFSRFGENGAVDVVGWRAAERALLLVEVKSEFDNLQNMLSVLDRKTRLVPALLEPERGWRAAVVGAILVMPDRSTFRDGIARFQATFAAALPSRNVEIRRWLARPGAGPLRGT